MTTNVPQEPDEFQTRMRQPAGEGAVEDTNRSGGGAPPTTPQAQQPSEQPAQAGQPPFAPPGFGGASAPQQPPAGYGPPQQQQAPPFGQPAPSFGQQNPAPQQPWAQQGAGGGYGQQPGYPQGGFSQQPGWASGPQKPRDASPLKAAFDVSFNTYATPGIVKLVYVVGIVLAVLWYVISVISAFAAFGSRDYGMFETQGTAVPGILMLLFGWIPVAFFVLALRLALEQVLSSVRTATDVRVLRERSDAEQKD